MPQGPGTYGKDNLMRNSILKKAAKGRSYTPGAEEQMFTKPKLDPMLYDEEGKRRKKPLSNEEQLKLMGLRDPNKPRKAKKKAKGTNLKPGVLDNRPYRGKYFPDIEGGD